MDEETKITESSITSSGSLLERYQSVSDAIDKILQGGQSYKIGSMIGSGIRNIGKSKQKLEAEQNYYDAVQYILDQVIS